MTQLHVSMKLLVEGDYSQFCIATNLPLVFQNLPWKAPFLSYPYSFHYMHKHHTLLLLCAAVITTLKLRLNLYYCPKLGEREVGHPYYMKSGQTLTSI